MDSINWSINEFDAKYLLQSYIDCELSRMEQKDWEVTDEECLAELQEFLLTEIIKVASAMKDEM